MTWVVVALLAGLVLLLGDDVCRSAPLLAVLLGAVWFVWRGVVAQHGSRVAPSRVTLEDRPAACLSRSTRAACDSVVTAFVGVAIPGYDDSRKGRLGWRGARVRGTPDARRHAGRPQDPHGALPRG